jgi:hypothetical protein
VSVGAALFLFQQLAGINAVVYYSTSVFRSAGIASDVAASALVGAANVFGKFTFISNKILISIREVQNMFSDGGYYLLIGTMVASSLMDKQGRKSLLITSFSGMVMPLCSTNHVFIFSLNQQMGDSSLHILFFLA